MQVQCCKTNHHISEQGSHYSGTFTEVYLSQPDSKKPEAENQELDIESRGTPETYTCNGSASKKTCKHQSKRERLERERELLKQQQENPNQEEEDQNDGSEGEGNKNPEEELDFCWRTL